MDLKLNELNGRKIRVSNIITESSGTSANFVIFGMLSRTDTDEPTPAAVHMDFSKVWGRDCVFDEANPEKGDFESWIPNEDSNKCIFGEMVNKKMVVYLLFSRLHIIVVKARVNAT